MWTDSWWVGRGSCFLFTWHEKAQFLNMSTSYKRQSCHEIKETGRQTQYCTECNLLGASKQAPRQDGGIYKLSETKVGHSQPDGICVSSRDINISSSVKKQSKQQRQKNRLS